MELQWPLILFTTFVAWCAGTFSAQAYLALRGKGEKIQLAAWITSAVLLVIGGVAVFMHLEHWERIFNGFGHITSGITQELIAIVVLAVVAIIYFVMMKRNEGKVPAWLAVCAILISVILVVVMGHSYMMEARPAWNNVLWVCSLIGAACILGPATVAIIAQIKGDEEAVAALGMPAIIGAVVNAVCTFAALLTCNAAQGTAFPTWYYDLTLPMKDITATAPGAFGNGALSILGVVIIGCICPIVCAILGKKSGNWKVWGSAAVVCAIVGAICLRAVFYLNGVSVFGIF